MQLIDGHPVYSATDLVGFLYCEHLTELERAALIGFVRKPNAPDPELDRIRARGFQHEQRYLSDLMADGKRVVDVSMPDDVRWTDRGDAIRAAAAATERAMQEHPDVIFQACLFDGTWLGFADFLVLNDRDMYEVVDTKLARTVKANAVLQMCSYTEQLTRLQGGVQPELMHVALGGSAREVKALRVADYMAYYRTMKRLFLDAVNRSEPPAYPPVSTYPEPIEHCEICRWAAICAPRRRADDHVSLVAGIASRTRKDLRESRGIDKRRQLAVLPADAKLDRTSHEALSRVREQARIQVEGEDSGRILHELLEPPRLETGELDPNKGLMALPAPRPGDLFLDLEGDPFALEDGVDYLFGVLEPGRIDADGQPAYHRFWSRGDDGRVTWPAEKRAFEQTIDLIMDRLRQDPALHVFHYAAYERTAFGRLMGRHRTREVEVDRLFRGGVLVDLYRAVQQGVRASVESYSIKRLEPLYGYEREVDLRDAGSSIVAFETWLEVGGEQGGEEETLERIARYNRDDVVSTWLLRDWLEGCRRDLEVKLGRVLSRPELSTGDAKDDLAEWLRRVEEVAKPLTAGVADKQADRTDQEHARWLLAQLLGWHRREDKASWWRYFHLKDKVTDEERVDEPEPIGMLTLVRVEDEATRRYRYSFPAQEYKLDADRVEDPDPGDWPGVEIVELDDEKLELVLRHKGKKALHHPRSLIPSGPPSTREQEQSLLRIGQSVVDSGIDGDGPFRAARDQLMRVHPRTGQGAGSTLRVPWERAIDAARRLALELDHTSLPIQGPPGSGKTWTGARMVLDLVAAGKRVGVTANGHKVIGNLLDAIWHAAAEAGRPIKIGQKPGRGEKPTCEHAIWYKENDRARDALADRSVDVVGGTGWLWSREDMQGIVDVLVIDEAGQFSLANAIAVSPAAESMILLGDPQQLDQPTQGSHPPGAERSALAHILDQESVMPPERGLFLERTWRLHPEIAAFTSEAFYRGKLLAEPGNERQTLTGLAPLDDVGIRWAPIDHEKNTSSSVEEAQWVADQVRALLDSDASWVDREGVERAVRIGDVLVVTPWNAHRVQLERAFRIRGLATDRIGTVDKFQGQQAPISIYSMATSTGEEAPRGMEFLYSLNRLNVATSRAQCLTVVVASPQLVRVRCTTPRQIELANALCRLVEVAGAA